nr:ribonuclease H-like domain-containing protein [Tanacetum cinerariifolium]
MTGDDNRDGDQPETSNPTPPIPPPTQQIPHTVSSIKLPILKKGEYDIWAMKMKHYLSHTYYPIWQVVTREKERKSRTILLMALLEDHLSKFPKMDDAKEMWEAIKSKFGGNDESKKMQKYLLKQQFEVFLCLPQKINDDDLEEIDLKGQSKGNQDSRRRDVRYNGNKARDNGRRPAYQDDSKALVTIDEEDIYWSGHVEEDTQKYVMMAYSSSNLGSDNESVFMNKECDLEDTPVNDRYAERMQAVPPSMTGNCMPSGPDVEIDYFKFTYGPKQTSVDESDFKPVEYASSESDSSVETTTSMPAPVDNAPKIVCEPKVWTDAPIIEEYESNSDDDSVFNVQEKIEKPSFAFIDYVKHVKSPRENIKETYIPNHIPKIEKHDRHGHTRKGLGYTRKACFICGSFSHLIRDCDFHEKRMEKQAALTKSKDKVTVQKENRPLWNNVQKGNGNTAAKASAGIVDSGCSRHMTRNKAHLADYQEFKGGSVAFRGRNGRITGKGKINAGRLDFEDVCYVKELKHYNLFFVSQMYDKKNKVLFTDTDCLVLSPDFKMPDENQNPSYKFTWADKEVPISEGSSVTTTETYMENYKNVSQDIRDQLNVEAEAVQIILTGIDNDIYSTINASIVNSSQPIYDEEPSVVAEDDEMSKDKEIDKLMAIISLSFKKIYKPTNKNLRTSSNTSKANQDNSPRINRGAGYNNQRLGIVAGARETVGTTVVQKSGIQCYNCKEFGHVAREYQKSKRAKDAAYHREKMLLYAADYGPIFDDDPLQKVSNNDNYNVFAIKSEHPEQSKSIHNTYLIEQDEHNVIIDSLDMSYDREHIDQNDDNDDLASERELLASLIEKLKCEIDDSKNHNKFFETSNKLLVEKLKGDIEDFKNKNKSLESSNNRFKEANNKLSETNALMYNDLKKFKTELDRRNDVEYASKVEINYAKAKGDLISYKMESQKSFNKYTQQINDLNQTISEMKKELSAHQETISILSQAKEAQIKLYKTREDKELDKFIALENKVKVLDNIVYKTSQSVQTMNMLNRNCKTSFAKPEFLKKANQVLLKIPRQHNMYSFNLKNIDPFGDLSCLFAKALID